MLSSVAGDFALGLLLGTVGGIFGIGGGLVAIPVLVWLFGMDQQLAQGTALVMIAPNVLLGFWRYKQRNPIEMKSAALLGLSSIASTWLVARYATTISSHSLRLAFACFLLAMAAFLLVELRRGKLAARPRPPLGQGWLGVLGLASGVCSGLFTVGGGLLVAPGVVKYFGVQRQTTAQGLALATVTPGAVVALWTYASAGRVDWDTGVPLAAGGLLSISWGVALAHSLPEKWLRLLFCALLSGTALTLL